MISYNVTISCSNAKFETQSPLPRGVPWIVGHAVESIKKLTNQIKYRT